MMQPTIRQMSEADIPAWLSLSHEYDGIVRELGEDLTHWYGGNETDPSFDAYMRAKLAQREAWMACGVHGKYVGVVAFSRRNNRITFFGVATRATYETVADLLLRTALDALDGTRDISITVLKSSHSSVQRERTFLLGHGFAPVGDVLENGVPVERLIKPGR